MKTLLRLPAKILVQLLKHQIVKLIGEGAAKTITEAATDAAGESFLAAYDRWIDAPETKRQIERVVSQAERLYRAVPMRGARSEALRERLLTHDATLMEAVNRIAESADETDIREAIISSLHLHSPDAGRAELEEVADGYLHCLRLCMLQLKDKAPAIVGRAVLRIEHSLRRVDSGVAEVRTMMTELLSQWKTHVSQNTAQAIIDYSEYIADKTRGFTGREFVFAAVRHFLDTRRSSYLLIRGDPGIGKTALMAELVRRHSYPHHFNIAAQGIVHARQFFLNSCAQLIARYGLEDMVLPEAALLGVGVLQKTLTAAAKKAGAEGVVLLVDALDEASAETVRANPLLLPYALAEGVRVIATTRRTAQELEIEAASVDVLELAPDSNDNLADVRTYIADFARRPGMAAALQSSRVGEAAFVRVLEEKSEGNFMYLRHVLPALEAGEFGSLAALRFDILPRGLRGYYERHWRKMRGESREMFVNVFQHVVAVLATARQPVSLALIAHVSKLDIAQVVWTVELWHEFLHQTDGEHDALFSVYHQSYRDFLAEKARVS